jgi:hypothetical protein
MNVVFTLLVSLVAVWAGMFSAHLASPVERWLQEEIR